MLVEKIVVFTAAGMTVTVHIQPTVNITRLFSIVTKEDQNVSKDVLGGFASLVYHSQVRSSLVVVDYMLFTYH